MRCTRKLFPAENETPGRKRSRVLWTRDPSPYVPIRSDRSDSADAEQTHGDEVQNDGEDDQSDDLQAEAALHHVLQLDLAGAVDDGVRGRSGRQHEGEVAGHRRWRSGAFREAA